MKHTLHRPLVPLTTALTLALALSLSACSQDEPAAFEETATQAVDTSAEPAADESSLDDSTETEPENIESAVDEGDNTADATDDVTEQSASAAGIDPSTLGEPVATVTVPANVQGDNDATMDVSLYSLTRDGETVVGVFSFHVNSENGDDEARWIYHYLGSQSWNPHLIDTTNLHRHDVLMQSGVRAATDHQGVKFRPGQTLFAYAAFAAPPADIDTVTVSLVDGGAAVQEVPVQ